MPPKPRAFAGPHLRAFRDWAGLSLADVAAILGFSPRTVADFEAQGAPEFVRLALYGWAVVVQGYERRAAARILGLPWRHYPIAGGTPLPAEAIPAELAGLATPARVNARGARGRSRAADDPGGAKLPPPLARHLRLLCEMPTREFSRLLQVNRSTYSRFEQAGGPAWLLPATAGVSILYRGAGTEEVCTMLGLDPDGGAGRAAGATCQPFDRLMVRKICYTDGAGAERRWP